MVYKLKDINAVKPVAVASSGDQRLYFVGRTKQEGLPVFAVSASTPKLSESTRLVLIEQLLKFSQDEWQWDDEALKEIEDDAVGTISMAETPKDIVDEYAERAAGQAQEMVNEWMEAIASLIQEIANKDTDDSAKFQELSDRLNDLYPELDVSGFAVPLAEAIATVRLAGRYEVVQEGGEI